MLVVAKLLFQYNDFRLRTKGYGVAKGIPTLIIAVASIDDATSIAAFGIIKSVIFIHSSVTSLVLQGPVSIFGGFGFGVLFGLLLRYVPERNDKFLVLELSLKITRSFIDIFVGSFSGINAFGNGNGSDLL